MAMEPAPKQWSKRVDPRGEIWAGSSNHQFYNVKWSCSKAKGGLNSTFPKNPTLSFLDLLVVHPVEMLNKDPQIYPFLPLYPPSPPAHSF